MEYVNNYNLVDNYIRYNNIDALININNEIKDNIRSFLSYYNELVVDIFIPMNNLKSKKHNKNNRYHKDKFTKDRRKKYYEQPVVNSNIVLKKSTNAWNGTSSTIDKTNKLVNGILNKLTKSNFDKLVNKLVVMLDNVVDLNVFNTLADTVLEKCT